MKEKIQAMSVTLADAILKSVNKENDPVKPLIELTIAKQFEELLEELES
jgi:hypothetical protein